MRSLFCPPDNYYPVTDIQEAKISKLIQAKKLPETFKLGNETVVSSTILGFTDDVPEAEQTSLKIRNMDELREHVKSQLWYKRSVAKRSEG